MAGDRMGSRLLSAGSCDGDAALDTRFDDVRMPRTFQGVVELTEHALAEIKQRAEADRACALVLAASQLSNREKADDSELGWRQLERLGAAGSRWWISSSSH